MTEINPRARPAFRWLRGTLRNILPDPGQTNALLSMLAMCSMIRAAAMYHLQQFRDKNPAEFRSLFTRVRQGDAEALGTLSKASGVEPWDLMELAAAAGVDAVCSAKDKWALFSCSYDERVLDVRNESEAIPLAITLKAKGVFNAPDLEPDARQCSGSCLPLPS